MDIDIVNNLHKVSSASEHFAREFKVTNGFFKPTDTINPQVLMMRFNALAELVADTQKLLESTKTEEVNEDDSDLCGRGYDLASSPNEFSWDYGSY